MSLSKENFSKKSRDLPKDRLATTDEKGHRVYLYVADVIGRFKSLRNKIHFILIVFFLVLPWIKIHGEQALLLDVVRRRFSVFGITFWGHDTPMLFFVIALFIVGIALVTAIFGRVWCGWACPETVFIESVFRRIESWVEGDAIERKTLDTSAWGFKKFKKKAIKWFLFFLVTLVISHSFLAYFVGTNRLLQMMQESPFEHPNSFLVMASVTALVLFAFGWFREQFCIIMCPYGRFQAVFMDEHSLVVAYDEKRGEPRKGIAATKEEAGDCVNCFRCVQVCPTGIDIRRGVQMECVACTACADACDEIMTKVHKPVGLIRYATEVELQGKDRKIIRPRTLILTAIFLGLAATFSYILAYREPLAFTLLRGKGSPYQQIKNEEGKNIVINQFHIEIENQTFSNAVVHLFLPLQDSFELVAPVNPVSVPGGGHQRVGFFIKFPKEILKNGHSELVLQLESTLENKTSSTQKSLFSQPIRLVGPYE